MKRNKLPNLVVVSILTLITAVMWVAFNIYRSLTTKPSPAIPSAISEPLTPSLDTQTIQGINSRIFFNKSQIPEVSAPTVTPSPSITPTEVPNPTPISTPISATESASPSPTP